ncbi:GNAT domain [Arabidopsis thaliana x Arabidopsis arenosa]|uniref:GNAT domain n=1 Tax=Arabidopsis thaliana x Arabidopsis arenosa TaxID=1240361 RepID=A0A8T2AAF4_9BRAS|nr:GNAT domain [Arabidopsis thaliana x Arabidopsis arenosa]
MEMDSQETQPIISSSPPGRISLRPMTLSDVDDYMVWATDPKVARFCTWEPCTSRDEAIKYITDRVLTHPWLRAICLEDDRPIGYILIMAVDNIRKEIGYVLARKYWGKGFATEAVRLVTAEVFKEFPEIERLEALVDVDNVGSQRVLEKVGFTKEGVMRKFLCIKGSVRDTVMFSFLPTDTLK